MVRRGLESPGECVFLLQCVDRDADVLRGDLEAQDFVVMMNDLVSLLLNDSPFLFEALSKELKLYAISFLSIPQNVQISPIPIPLMPGISMPIL